MTYLVTFDAASGRRLAATQERRQIAAVIGGAGIELDCWDIPSDLAATASAAQILAAYSVPLNRLSAARGYTTSDVVALTPDHPDRDALRTKFLSEHAHGDDEVRFFAAGIGAFYLHIDGHVQALVCERGDLVLVPSEHAIGLTQVRGRTSSPFAYSPTPVAGSPSTPAIRLPTEYHGSSLEVSRLSDGASALVLDIEGTTTPISFVRDVLFPYARARLAETVRTAGGSAEVRAALAQLAASVGSTTLSEDDAIGRLLALSDADVKHPALKALQGIAWRGGYADGSLVAPLYPDVAPTLRAWRSQGHHLYIYSSGSVEAQRLLFGHTVEGDLRPLFTGWFDATIGAKTSPASFAAIAKAIARPASALLFVSDHDGEVSAARQAAWRSLLIDRGVPPVKGAITTFLDIEI